MSGGLSGVTMAVATFPMPFRIVFKHTSAARAATENVIVRLTDEAGFTGYGEGCPRAYVTGETTTSARAFLAERGAGVLAAVDDVAGLRQWMDGHRALIDRHPAAFCALELAVLDLLGRRGACAVEGLLGRPAPAGPFHYSAVLGDSRPLTYLAQLARYGVGGLRHYKLKLSGDLDRDRSKLRWFGGRLGRFVATTVRVDANNLWTDPGRAAEHLLALGHPLLGVEEPLAANDLDGFLTIAERVDTRIILDESLLRKGQIGDLPGEPGRWILNCRISKSGGIIRSLDLIDAARSAGLGVIVGAHVGETSLLTRAALTAAAAAGPSLLAQEGAFGTYLLTRDVCDDPVMFGRRGVLGSDGLAAIGPHGLGIEVVGERLADLEAVRRC